MRNAMLLLFLSLIALASSAQVDPNSTPQLGGTLDVNQKAICDGDGDTCLELEQGADDDTIRLTAGGVVSTITSTDFTVGSGVAFNLTEIDAGYWGAGAMEVDGAQCAPATPTELVTNGPNRLTIACKQSNLATIGNGMTLPKGWDGGTVTFELEVVQIAASTGAYVMDFEAQCVGSGESMLAWSGTGEQAATITLVADDKIFKATTAAVTLNGTTCAGGDTVDWQGAINAAASAANLQDLAVVRSVKLFFTRTGDDS